MRASPGSRLPLALPGEGVLDGEGAAFEDHGLAFPDQDGRRGFVAEGAEVAVGPDTGDGECGPREVGAAVLFHGMYELVEGVAKGRAATDLGHEARGDEARGEVGLDAGAEAVAEEDRGAFEVAVALDHVAARRAGALGTLGGVEVGVEVRHGLSSQRLFVGSARSVRSTRRSTSSSLRAVFSPRKLTIS